MKSVQFITLKKKKDTMSAGNKNLLSFATEFQMQISSQCTVVFCIIYNLSRKEK